MALSLTACSQSDAEMAVRDKMLDPDATQFKDIRPCPADKDMTVGQANGKNLMGAFTGFRPFFYKNHHVALLDDSDFTSMMKACYGDLISDEIADFERVEPRSANTAD